MKKKIVSNAEKLLLTVKTLTGPARSIQGLIVEKCTDAVVKKEKKPLAVRVQNM